MGMTAKKKSRKKLGMVRKKLARTPGRHTALGPAKISIDHATGRVTFEQMNDHKDWRQRRIEQAVDDLNETIQRDAEDQELLELELTNQIRAFEVRTKLLNQSLSVSDVVRLLKLKSRQTPHDRVEAKSLLALKDQGQLRFPYWQFDAAGSDGVVPGLQRVLRAMDASPFAQALWLSSTCAAFNGVTPIDLLRRGEVDRVVAQALGIEAASL